MENNLLINDNFGEFLKEREREILKVVQKSTEEMVKTELALMEFELLLSTDLKEKDLVLLNKTSKTLREECWNEVNERFNNNHNKIMTFLEEI